MIFDFNTKPYFLKINTPEDKIVEIFENTDYSNHQDIIDISAEVKRQTYHDISNVETIIFCTPKMVEKIIIANEFHGFDFSIVEAQDLLFHNKLDLSKADNTFKNLVNQFIYRNFDADDVMDKILENAELTEIDHLILKNH